MVEPARSRAADFLTASRDAIVAEWAQRVRLLPHARSLERPRLVDHVPQLLEQIAKHIARGEASSPALAGIPEVHALDRLDLGFDVGEVTAEYAELRRCLARAWARAGQVDDTGLEELNGGIDRAVQAAVTGYARARQRTVEGLERASALALEPEVPYHEFLDRLLRVMVDTLEATDVATIFLTEKGTELVASAFVGGDKSTGAALARQAVAERRPISRTAGSKTHEPQTPGTAVLAEYAVPLLRDGVAGAVYVASRTAHDFGGDDKMLFRALASRASLLIEQRRTRVALEEALAARNRILQVVSHDLAGAVHVLMLSATRLASSDHNSLEVDGKMRRVSENMVRGLQGMGRMIHDLVDLAAIDAHELAIKAKPVDAAALMLEAVDLNGPRALEKSIRMVSDEDSTPGVWVLADRDRVFQVFANLIGNAVKFTPPGGTIEVHARHEEAEEVRFGVQDSGPGVPEEDVSVIFGYGVRGQSDEAGRGLGLAIAKGIVEAHGGRIWAAPGPGGRFFFTLPRCPAPAS